MGEPRSERYCYGFAMSLNDPGQGLSERGKTDEIILDFTDYLPDYCLDWPTNRTEQWESFGIRLYEYSGDNWIFDGLELTINDKENCDTIVYNYPVMKFF